MMKMEAFDDEDDEMDIDDLVDANGQIKESLPAPLQSRISNSSRQKCKVIGSYIEKLQEDIRILKEVRAGLTGVQEQLEKEKPDIQLFERVSKEAIVALQNTTNNTNSNHNSA